MKQQSYTFCRGGREKATPHSPSTILPALHHRRLRWPCGWPPGQRLPRPPRSLRHQGARKAHGAGSTCTKDLGVRGGNGSMQAKPLESKRFWNHLPQPGPLVWSSTVQLVLREDVLEELVDRPGDGRGGDLVDDPGLDALEVAGQAVEPVHRPEGVGHA